MHLTVLCQAYNGSLDHIKVKFIIEEEKCGIGFDFRWIEWSAPLDCHPARHQGTCIKRGTKSRKRFAKPDLGQRGQNFTIERCGRLYSTLTFPNSIPPHLLSLLDIAYVSVQSLSTMTP